jgi:S-adenosylmethionine synthetase
MSTNYLFTSESVSEGHPDKVCDQISDAVVDLYLEKSDQKDQVRVACETMVTTNKVIVAGEVRGSNITNNEIESVARAVVKEIGYEQKNFHWKNFDFNCFLHAQSIDIAQGVDANKSRTEGAGDQGIMFGYACTETKEFMPAPIHFSHLILKDLARERKAGNAPGILPDSKSQVTLLYNEENKPIGCDNIVVSTQHGPNITKNKIFDYLYPIIKNVLPQDWMPPEEKIFINPTGKFEIGGPDGDAGLTGRKIIVDTYGGACPHGGGAFSGKDPSKVDRSAAYAARYVAKNIVYAGLAERCTIQLAYAIGMVEPLSVYVNTYETGKMNDLELKNLINQIFDLTPRGIRDMLNLSKVNYLSTSAYGHFGRESEGADSFTWEKTDKAESILGYLK